MVDTKLTTACTDGQILEASSGNFVCANAASGGDWTKTVNDLSYIAGSVSIGTASQEASALLQIASTTKGFLPPRMTTTQRDAIASPATGLILFNTTDNNHQFYNGSLWSSLGGGSSTGLVGTFPTATCPTGWIVADGSAISRTTYASLFSSLSTMYGVGDGSTTFNLPDYRGQFLRGHDNGAGLDPDAGSRTDRGDGTTGDVVGSKQADGIGSHTHDINNSSGGAVNGSLGHAGANNNGSNSGRDTENTGTNIGNETRPTNVNVTYCVNYSAAIASGSGYSADGSTPLTGNIKLNDNYLSNDGGDEGIRIDDAGNVGIGSATPTTKLDVVGTVTATALAGDGAAITNLDSQFKIVYGSFSWSTTADGSTWDDVSTADCGAGYQVISCSFRHDYDRSKVSNLCDKYWSIAGTVCTGRARSNLTSTCGGSVTVSCVKE
jgi:microcystin-dependent protein